MTSNSFFDEQKEQSLIKARIVEKYFWVWAKVIISTIKASRKPELEPRIAYIDLFAGAGRYKDGSASTPVKVLETAIADPDMRSMLVSMFNDADAENVGSYGATIVLAQLTITLPTPNFPNKRTPSHLQTGSDRAA